MVKSLPIYRSLTSFAALVFLLVTRAYGVVLAPVPAEMASNHFTVTIDGKPTPVMHAAVNLYFLNFESGKRTKITVTASTDDFWAKGVEVQPWRLGIRPVRSGRTISFTLAGPAKITISRPGDYLSDAEMLYLFANAKEVHAPKAATAKLRYYGPGAHHENIDAQTGDTIYLAPGAVVFGALNVWGVENVKVFGRGVIVYDGPQNPASDDGWKHQRNWHCIVMDRAKNISIEGITCVVRSRTWQIQMKDSRDIVYDNVKVIGANTGNANADGMDWLGGGDTVVRNSFFRAADDVFAMYGSWEGYGPVAFAVDGNPVTNIKIENTVVSTSISNVVRVAWPEKNFEGGHFSMTDSDVLHAGMGGCGIPFALMEVWADPHGRGKSGDFLFQNIRLEDWYSLTQLRQSAPGEVSGVRFTDVAGLELPAMVPSVIEGEVRDVAVDNFVQGGMAVRSARQGQLVVEGATAPVAVSNSVSDVQVSTTPGLLRPGQAVEFKAAVVSGSSEGLTYAWIFGDGTAPAEGASVTHTFADARGTLLDGSGRFRVLLHVASASGRNTWLYVPVIVANQLAPALPEASSEPGLHYSYTEAGGAARTGVAASVDVAALEHGAGPYSLELTGMIEVPVDAGYALTLVANDAASITIDGRKLGATRTPFKQVCGLKGNAARPVTVSVALAKGKHRLQIEEAHGAGVDDLRLYWQAPDVPLSTVPAEALSH